MVEFSDRNSLENWLEGRPREECIAIAARAALRVLPLSAEIFAANLDTDKQKNFVLTVFRAAAISRAASHVPARDIEQAAKAAYGSATTVATFSANAATSIVANAAADAADATLTNSIYAAPTDTAAAAAVTDAAVTDAANADAANADAAMWDAVSADATALEGGWSAARLADAPLWPAAPPDDILENWHRLKSELHRYTAEDWGVWTGWYEARLRGDHPNAALERARALDITNEMWDAGPQVVNPELRRLIEKHRPTREELAKTADSQPVLINGLLDVRPNEPYSTPDGSADLARLPAVQRSVIRTLIAAIGAPGNIQAGVTTALQEYSDELLVRGSRPYLDLLKLQHQIVRDEYLNLNREGMIIRDGLRRSFLSFFAIHKQIIGHFPLDAERERLYRDTPLNRSAWDAGDIRSLSDEFTNAVSAAETAGIATPDFVKASLGIAEDLKAATYVAPPAPVDAMARNRDFLEPPELNAADRAVIRAMVFTDSLRELLDGIEVPEKVKEKTKEISLQIVIGLIVNALSGLIFKK